MATIKSFSDLEQSKKLAEILPLESADMWYDNDGESIAGRPEVRCGSFIGLSRINIPCWSLAALLGVLPDYTLQDNPDGTVFVISGKKKPIISDDYDNPVDACYEIILKLNEFKML